MANEHAKKVMSNELRLLEESREQLQRRLREIREDEKELIQEMEKNVKFQEELKGALRLLEKSEANA